MTVAPGVHDLTTLAAVKSWAKATGVTDDDLLQNLLTRVSRAILTSVNRPTFYGRTVSSRINGSRGCRIMLPDYPVTSISVLTIGSQLVPVAPDPLAPAGFLLEPWDGVPPGSAQAVDLFGYGMWQSPQLVGITYRTGYEVIDEAATIPATPFAIAPAAPWGPAMADSGVTKAGVAMTRVAAAATPTTGQYKFTQDTATGLWSYTFAAADTGQAVLLSYSYAPADVFQAATEWASERYRYRDRQGETSRTAAGQQTSAYDISALPKFVDSVLQQYRAVGPLF